MNPIYMHNKRTVQFTYKAEDKMGHKVANLIRDIYGPKGYKVTTDRAEGNVQMVAITNLSTGKHPVPNYMVQQIPSLIMGYLIGFNDGHIMGKVGLDIVRKSGSKHQMGELTNQ